MRIIAGSLKGRGIQPVKGDNTRPTTDKVKENVFNIMGQFFEGGRVLDLFAGSGNLGIEALSRGMDYAVFIEMNVHAFKTIKENIAHLKLQEQTEVYRNDAFKALNVLAKKGAKFDLIFLDPPYGKVSMTALLESVKENNLLNDDGLIMCEYGTGIEVEYDEQAFKELRRGAYGMTQVLILEKGGNE